jgi:cellulose synthase/poly-beta-1,6-N-acetylglucosamine synthase-like glycosyltransferase
MQDPKPQTPGKIAFLILAHNETSVIGSTVASLLEELSKEDALFVVADNCTDLTADRAREAGARVCVRTSGHPDGKGKALAWFMQAQGHLLQGVDALVILDADSKVKPGFGSTVKANLPGKSRAYQCLLLPVSTDQSPVGKLAALSELLDQYLSDRIRTTLNWPVRLRGTGMILQPESLAAISEKLETEVEDIALTLLLTTKGIIPSRMEAAIVFDQKPGTSGAATEQRARWFRGQWVALWHYRHEVGRMIGKGPAGWTLLGSLFLRPKWLIVAIDLLLAILLLHWPWLSLVFWLLVILSLAYYTLGILLIPERKVYLRALLYTPAFIWMWIRSLLLALRSSSWRRTRD